MLDGHLPDAEQILDACQKALNESAAARKRETPAHCVSFVPTSGGVGQSVLAATLALLTCSNRKQPKSTCLIDLNFQYSRLAHYLDVEPRLDLSAIEAAPERVDQTLMEVMLTRHQSGLAVAHGFARSSRSRQSGSPGRSQHAQRCQQHVRLRSD